MPDKSLINFGDLSSIATKLIDKVSDATGVLYEPTRMLRKAKAEQKIKKLEAQTNIEITDIEQRAVKRFLHEEARKQGNIEAVTSAAIGNLDEATAQPENIDEDWLVHFFDRAKLIGDEEMQLIWGKILAGEANEPGQFSKRLLNLLSTLTKEEAIFFQSLTQVVISSDDSNIPFINFDYRDWYDKWGFTYSRLSHLESIGLLKIEINQFYSILDYPLETKKLKYFDTEIQLIFSENIIPVSTNPYKKQIHVSTGNCMFTELGKELYLITDKQKNENFEAKLGMLFKQDIPGCYVSVIKSA